MMRIRNLLLIFSVSFIIYLNSLAGEFVWDDECFVVKNASIKSLKNIISFFGEPSTAAPGDLSKEAYRPFTTLSYAVDYRLWRLKAVGYHLTNVIIHSLNALLVFIIIYLISQDAFIAFFASLFFAAHPIQTEAVSWISGRSSVIFLFTYLLALIFYVKRSYVWPILFFIVSLFSKEMAISLPLILILYDIHYPRGEKIKDNFLKKYLPYFILAPGYILIRYALLGRMGQFKGWGSPYETFLTMTVVIVDYIKILLLPVTLCANYLMPVATSIADPKVCLSIITLAGIFGLAYFISRRSKIASFFIWWFFITLLPVLNIIPIKMLKAERFLYLPSIGFYALLALAIGRLRDKKRAIALFLAGVIVIAYSLRTLCRNEDWKDTVTISKKTVEASPLNSWALSSLGVYYINKGDYDRALAPLKKAVILEKDFYIARQNLGVWYLHFNRYDEAIREFKLALALRPDLSNARQGLGICYAMTGRYDDAKKEFITVLKDEPAAITSFLNLGRLYEMKGDYAKSLGYYGKIIENTKDSPDTAVAYMRIGDLYQKMGDSEKAQIYHKKATDISGGTLIAPRRY